MTLERARFSSVADLLAASRAQLDRFDVARTLTACKEGWQIVDIRPAWQRAREGEIEGALIVERNHLEWRLDRSSGASVHDAQTAVGWIVVCSEGYTSSLAAASLQSLGIAATDLVGGVQAWREAGLELLAGITSADATVVPGDQLRTADPTALGAPHSDPEDLHPER